MFLFFTCSLSGDEEFTTSYDEVKPLVNWSIGSHATTRLFDWDQDGDLDLILGGGDGRLWLCRRDEAGWGKRESITIGEQEQWGKSYTGAVLADICGDDGLPDLVVGHSGNRVSIYANTGEPGGPEFQRNSIEVIVQDGCQGRLDVGDWDGDGLLDLVTGSFGGKLLWFQNSGNLDTPSFAGGEPFHEISRAYNSQPRIIDFNRDGLLDLVLGVNWGTVEVFLNRGAPRKPDLGARIFLQWAEEGKPLNIRNENGDDTTPDFGDIDGDGVMDLISGGKNGKVFLMRGIGRRTKLDALRQGLSHHPRDGEKTFGLLKSLRTELAGGLVSPVERKNLFRELVRLSEDYPGILQRRDYDLKTEGHAPMLLGQYAVLLLECGPDTREHRAEVARIAGFGEGYTGLLVDAGVVFVDNNAATLEHLEKMRELLVAMPRNTWDVQVITAAGWLGEGAKSCRISSRSGINIFSIPLGQKENSFANDAPRPGVTDVYLICLAHEIAHNMLDTVGRRLRPELYEYKFEGLARSAGPEVIFHEPKSRGVNREATRAKFQEIGVWDGAKGTWPAAWKSYFRNVKNAPRFNRAHVRGNIQFFLDAPQEAFATLANQYFADSRLMLEFCKVRWDAGYRSNINQFLLIADYLSENSDSVPFYVLEAGGELKVATAILERDTRGRISGIKFEEIQASFQYDEGRVVTEFELEES